MSSGTGLTGSHDERRLFEHFVIAGLSDNKPLTRLKHSSEECGLRNTQPLAPITDIAVIFPSLGEKPPDGFDVIETTTLGYPADLNHGSLGQKSCFLCFRRGYHKAPLVDIGILDEGRGDKPMVDSNVVQTTPFGRCTNVNNASQGIFLTYRRAPPNSSQSQFVVTDFKVILANKGEIPPHTYYKITKNLNKGLLGSDVFICYKKSQGTAKRLAYTPAVLDYFPRTDHSDEMEDFKLAQNVAMFCLPMGALIECWPTKCAPPDRSFSTFVLTDEVCNCLENKKLSSICFQNGTKFYGSAVTFYEKYTKELTEDQLEKLDLRSSENDQEGGTVGDSNSNNDPADDVLFYKNVSICLISRFPFFNSFKRFLFFLHRMSSTPSCAYPVPIERYISHLMYEVSFPTPRRPRVFMQLGAENISFDSHDDSQLPLNGTQLIDTLKYLGSDNLMYLMLLALLEQKILIHSLRPWMLAAVAESVCALMFPFHLQCPYIPQCPLGLAGVLHAPLPFIAGVDSRYFELYEDPPDDVTCFDLDTSTISFSSVRATFKTSMLPKKPAKQLKTTLEDIFSKLQQMDYLSNEKNEGGFIPVDQDLKKQQKRREFSAHSALFDRSGYSNKDSDGISLLPPHYSYQQSSQSGSDCECRHKIDEEKPVQVGKNKIEVKEQFFCSCFICLGAYSSLLSSETCHTGEVFGSLTNLYMFRMLTGLALIGGLALPWCGFMFGCFTALLTKRKPEDVTAIAVETGIQNTGIAILLLKASFGQPDADIGSLIPVIVAAFTPGPLLLGAAVHLTFKWMRNRRQKSTDADSIEKQAVELIDASKLTEQQKLSLPNNPYESLLDTSTTTTN
ncbi:hypothetical protein CAEBREN_29681 [Caenorhabditis brenneri]|uniref:Uncharacterized protein n=1 Tax=Caenorhabditis brenneri TaxID=135651 RepID=G0N030_CAEBE|nr:hypothetical protein CAEBREN_29681 [Caenorhabditis brenneri]